MPSDYEAATNTLIYDKAKTLQIKSFDEFLFSRFSVFFHANADLTTTYVYFSLKYKENSERKRRDCLLFYYKNKLVILLRLLLNRIRTKQFFFQIEMIIKETYSDK